VGFFLVVEWASFLFCSFGPIPARREWQQTQADYKACCHAAKWEPSVRRKAQTVQFMTAWHGDAQLDH